MRSNRAMPVRSWWVALVALGLTATASAVVPHQSPHLAADTLTAMPGVIARPLRTYRTLATVQPTAAWKRFVAMAGGSWESDWDAATGVPSRIYGSGIAAPGSIASAAVAEQVARQVLADHIALLAPGSQASDFVLVSNSYDGNIRSVGFLQYAGGLRVVGGQVSFRFKRDRLFVIGSEALPAVVAPHVAYVKSVLRARATAAARSALGLPDAPVSEPGDAVILPLVGDVAVLGYRVAAPMTVEGGAGARYLAYADPASGALLAVRQLDEFATGTVVYNGVDRYPQHGRVDRPAPRAFVTLDGAAVTTGLDGSVSWGDDTTQTLIPSVNGSLVMLVNMGASGLVPTTTMALAPGGQARWDASAVPEADAQLQIYLDINIVKDFVRANVDANLPKLNDVLVANANLDMSCNAFYDGVAINFFHATTMCQNSGLVQDVLFHEFGHDVHENEIIPGVGAFDGAMSEGVADTLAVNITGDSGMGRGFFYNNESIRELNPTNKEYRYPQDIGELHQTGLIFGGTFWDLRTAFINLLGPDAGEAKFLQIYVGVLRRSIDIPSTLVEALATDDDDGDLSNGTPNECLIRQVFGAHGLRTLAGTTDAPATLEQPTLATTVTVHLTGESPRCSDAAIRRTFIEWHPGASGLPVAGLVLADMGSPSSFSGQIPLAVDDSVGYKALIAFEDGTTFALADNLADPFYQLYDGATVPLYCTTFDSDPFAEGWSQDSANQWSWGVPGGGATDPHAAFSGTHILSQVLDGDYPASASTFVRLPPIDTGHYSDVRLQYRRWLAVDDSHFDQAHITANGNVAWQNATSDLGDSSALHHIDKEWRFHDVPLTKFFSGHTLNVGFDLKADGALQLGGWALDDLCVVANLDSICGDGVVSATEECDSGSANADAADACRSDCKKPVCGDNIVDSGEECDEGSGGTIGCSNKCLTNTIAPTGCCSANGGAGSILLGILVIGVARRRRTTGR